MSIPMKNIPTNQLSNRSIQTVITLLIAVFFLTASQYGQALVPRNGQDTEDKRSFKFTYHASINDIPDSAHSVQAFIPVPQSGKHQTIDNLDVRCDYDYLFVRDKAFGNKLLMIQLNSQSLPDTIPVTLSFDVQRQAVRDAEDYITDINDRSRYLQPDSLIPHDEQIIAEAEKVTEAGMAKSQMTKSFYDRLIGTMEYDKSGRGWGRGDALFACNKREGNCTDFHSLFIGMSRVRDIPARFAIGFPIPPDQKKGTIGGYHCWASFYQSGKGWVPVDISEAWKHRDRKQFYYGALDADRVLFTRSRDIPLPVEKGQDVQLNYFIYPHVRVNGQSYDNVTTEFTFRDL